MAKSNRPANKVNIELDMFGSSMMNRFLREVDGRDVVPVDNRGLGNVEGELMKKLS